MKLISALCRQTFVILIAIIYILPASAQHNTTTAQFLKKYPGVNKEQLSILLQAKKQYPVPLPTWLPAGFKVEKMKVLVEQKIPVDDRKLEITYSRVLQDGKKQSFMIRAGIEGIGSLVYEVTDSVQTAFGVVYLAYQPMDDGDTKRMMNYACTEWFTCDKIEYDFSSGDAMTGNPTKEKLVSRKDALKILASLQKL